MYDIKLKIWVDHKSECIVRKVKLPVVPFPDSYIMSSVGKHDYPIELLVGSADSFCFHDNGLIEIMVVDEEDFNMEPSIVAVYLEAGWCWHKDESDVDKLDKGGTHNRDLN